MTWARKVSLAELADGGLFTDGDWVESKDQDPSGTVRLTQLADVGIGEFRDRSNRWLRPDQATNLRCTFLEPGDVLIARMPDPIGRACLAPASIGSAVTAVDVSILRIRRPDVEARYVLWAINSPRFHAEVEARQSGTTRKRISRKNLGALTVPVPPLDEQRRIVDLLEDHLSRLDVADREVVRASHKLDALWRSALTATRNSFSVLPRAIGDIASTSLGKMLDAKKQSGEPIPYLRNINVRWGSFDLADLRTTPLEPDEVAKFDVREGDVMVCEGGEPGRCAVWRGDGSGIAFQKALHRIRVAHQAEVLPDFLALMLEECIRSGRADRLFTGTTIKHLPQEKLRTIEIVLPSLDDQRSALQRLAEVAEERERLRSSLTHGMRNSQALRRSLLAAAFSGRLTGAESDLSAAEEMIGA